MGIINLTPDSFFKDSRANSIETVVATAGKMLAEGVTILDIGGFSTRPGAQPVTEEEEPSTPGMLNDASEALLDAPFIGYASCLHNLAKNCFTGCCPKCKEEVSITSKMVGTCLILKWVSIYLFWLTCSYFEYYFIIIRICESTYVNKFVKFILKKIVQKGYIY